MKDPDYAPYMKLRGVNFHSLQKFLSSHYLSLSFGTEHNYSYSLFTHFLIISCMYTGVFVFACIMVSKHEEFLSMMLYILREIIRQLKMKSLRRL